MKPYVLFMTGAGISASAGIKTYRDGTSSWVDGDLEKKSHATRYGNHLDELWDKHWGPMQKAMATAEPTAAHKAIADFQKQHQSIVATQNIDDLHERAGSGNIAHLHGVMNTLCMKCKEHAASSYMQEWNGLGAPCCYRCNKRKTRPDVVLFGEMLSSKTVKALEAFTNDISHLIVVGTSLNVFPAAGIVMDGIKPDIESIFVNAEEIPMTKFFKQKHIGNADELLPGVLEEVARQRLTG